MMIHCFIPQLYEKCSMLTKAVHFFIGNERESFGMFAPARREQTDQGKRLGDSLCS
jgi:hypothetical protein